MSSPLTEIVSRLNSERVLRSPLTDDILIAFLTADRGDVDKTVARIKRYANLNKTSPKWFGQFDDAIALCDAGLGGVASKRSFDGQTVIFMDSSSKWKPDVISYDQLQSGIVSTFDALADNRGVVLVMNGDFGFKQARAVSPSSSAPFMSLLDTSLPARLDKMIVANSGALFRGVWTVVKPFLSKELQDKVIVTKDFKVLKEILPEDAIPSEYKGEGGPFPSGELKGKLLALEATLKTRWLSFNN